MKRPPEGAVETLGCATDWPNGPPITNVFRPLPSFVPTFPELRRTGRAGRYVDMFLGLNPRLSPVVPSGQSPGNPFGTTKPHTRPHFRLRIIAPTEDEDDDENEDEMLTTVAITKPPFEG
jgi:hypothetical protein